MKHDFSLENRIHQHALEKYYKKIDSSYYSLVDTPSCTRKLLEESILETLPETKKYILEREKEWEEKIEGLNIQ